MSDVLKPDKPEGAARKLLEAEHRLAEQLEARKAELKTVEAQAGDDVLASMLDGGKTTARRVERHKIASDIDSLDRAVEQARKQRREAIEAGFRAEESESVPALTTCGNGRKPTNAKCWDKRRRTREPTPDMSRTWARGSSGTRRSC